MFSGRQNLYPSASDYLSGGVHMLDLINMQVEPTTDLT